MARLRESSQRGSAANPQGGPLRRAAEPRWRRLTGARRREVRRIRVTPRNRAVAALVAVVGIAAVVWVVRGGGDAEPLPGTALRTLAKARGIELGTAVRGDVLKRN